ncbi:leucine-rich repeat and transmembrane domain-containing protein 1 [Phyllopteryx taeniolatus]|uniref:leucine-rich repeat and transmembrane domain-containing protein 1 n=1 Tax=Phyllopteryx taeniolatus TaxID=161469 RepID=UPI002AD59DDD|nr:leucine-rich repeat and transmembrane domain-containing protein 1 [Phyllopteryx taeniolatus]
MLLSRCGVLLVLCMCPHVGIAMPPCPVGCCCLRPGFLVLCESLGLRRLPRSVPLGAAVLSVAKNRLCNVDHLLRPFASLQELSLSHNLLGRFPRGLPPSLEVLFLQHNRIAYITFGAVRKLWNLIRLDLEDNLIRAIQPGALRGLEKLQVLMLKGNRLSSIPPNLPPSLTHLDLSANCISALGLPSLSPLVNLHVLKISSNRLRSFSDSISGKVPHLPSAELTDSLWVCDCDILYLYRGTVSSRFRMTSTDVACAEPDHLAHSPLLNLSIATISPSVLKPDDKTIQLKTLTANPAASRVRRLLRECWSTQPMARDTTAGGHLPQATVPKTQFLDEHLSLDTLTYEDCLSQKRTQTVTVPYSTASPREEKKCKDNTTTCYSQMITTHPTETQSLSTSNLLRSELNWLPAVLCVLLLLLTVLPLLVLKKLLQRQQRVAPLDRDDFGGH